MTLKNNLPSTKVGNSISRLSEVFYAAAENSPVWQESKVFYFVFYPRMPFNLWDHM